MARPTGPQITIICAVCGATQTFPPSKAAGRKYCSRSCRDKGLVISTDWSHVLESECVIYRLPEGPDPDGRGMIIDGRLLIQKGGQWQQLELQRLPYGSNYRIISRAPINAPEAT